MKFTLFAYIRFDWITSAEAVSQYTMGQIPSQLVYQQNISANFDVSAIYLNNPIQTLRVFIACKPTPV